MRSRHRFVSYFFSLLLFLTFAPAYAAVSHLSGEDWYSLESEHFILHYPLALAPQVQPVLAMAERVHGELSEFIHWQPARQTEIVLSDEFDLSNGFTSPLPDNRITLFLSAPDDLSSLEDHGGWLELVFTHEYLHALHLDKATGAVSVMRKIFGRFPLLFPNAWQPSWFIEGLATYAETDRQRGIGRGQSSYYDMMMRMESLDGIKPLRQVNQPMASWPMGSAPYLYGVFFYQYVAERFGEKKVAALVGNYSNNLIPFRILSNTQQTLGVDLDTLWNDFSEHLKQRYRAQREAMQKRGLSPAVKLTESGYYHDSMAINDAGNLYYTAFDAESRPGMMRRNRNGETERLFDTTSYSRFDLHPQQGLLLARLEVCDNAAWYYDLYRYNLNGGDEQRLTHCGRYRFAIWSPDGQRIAAVHNAEGVNTLQLLDGEGKLLEEVWRGEPGEVISHMDWSPDGGHIAASLWRKGEGWNIGLLDLASGKWRRLTDSPAIENHPRFTADGRALLFTADYDGVYNIRRVELDSGKVSTLTNVVGGAFNPLMAGDALYFIGYNPNGFDIYRLDHPTALGVVRPVAAGSSGTVAAAPPSIKVGEPYPYSPWWSMLPRWWFPYLDVQADSHAEIGVITSGSDTLNRHMYALTFAYDVENEWATGSVDYIYDRWLPILKLHASSYQERSYEGDDLLVRSRRNNNYQAEVVIPWLTVQSLWSLHLGVAEESSRDSFRDTSVAAWPEQVDRLAGAAITYASTIRLPRSISRSDGREVMLVHEDSDLLEGSDYAGQAASIDWREFIPLGGEHVLGVRLVAAEADETMRPYRLGGLEDINPLPFLFDSPAASSPFNRRHYSLRGYQSGLPQLTGNNMRLASLEYRFPLGRFERGWMTPPIGLHQLHGALFTESGAAWSGDAADARFHSSYGIELGADTTLFYNMGLNLTLGYAKGEEAIGEEQFYLRIGAGF